uniref:Phosphatidylinositol glycan anchor biosynthesis class G n=1 Tax=Astyanax mexicanus TaxID=7994 RepID=A0A8B9RHK5_ASTMX
MRLSSSVFAAVCLLIELLGIALFLRGFFPVPIKSSLSTKSKLSDLPAEPHAGSSQPNSTKVPSPLFKRVVIVLIDALREDFVFGPNGKRFMPYTRHIVERGSSHSFIAKARPPTVTMPRIKVSLKMNRILFILCTWTEFPFHLFIFSSPANPPPSMVVKCVCALSVLVLCCFDTCRVLQESEGSLPNLLVLCGDHGMSETGSHGGSSEPEVSTPLVLISPAFQRKGKPGVVEQVDLPPTLALALALPISQNSVGRLIPAMFEEASLREQLRFFHINGHQLSSLLRDSNPNFHKEDGYEQFRVAEKAHGNWMKLYMEGNASEVLGNMGKKVLKQYLEALQAMSAALSKQLGKYDIYSMIVGMILVLQVLVLLLLAMPEALSGAACVDVPVAPAFLSLPFYLLSLLGSSVHVLVCTSAEASCYFCSLPWLLAFSAILFSSALLCSLVVMAAKWVPLPSSSQPKKSSDWTLSELDVLLLTGTVGHTLSLGASSFVEEEHQTWYFLLNTLCLAVFQDVCRKYFRERRQSSDEEEEGPLLPSTVEEDPTRATFSPTAELGVSVGSEKWLALATPILTLACCRLLRSLNQTGVQWAHLPDLSHWLNSMVFRAELTLLHVPRVFRTGEARFVYVFVLGILFTGVKDLLRSQVMSSAVEGRRLKSRGLWEAYSGVVLLVALLVRAHNLPTLACCLLIQTLMAQFIWKKLHYDAAQTTIMHYWFGQAFFYFQGNSNNIATVDISVGFVGLESYVEAPAVFLTAFSTYAGPLLWACHLVCYLSSERDRAAVSLGHGSYCFALLRSIPAVFYVVLVTALRYHLFIWSVFSPKLLYESMHTLVTAAVCLFFTFMDQDRTRRP